jgi:hypothetical protein
MTTINNTGSTLVVLSSGINGQLDFTGTITGGVVINAYSTLDFGGATLQNLVWQGPLSANSGTMVADGLTVEAGSGNGTIALGNATLAVAGGTIDNLTLQVTGSQAALEDVLGTAGGYSIYDGGNAQYTLGSHAAVDVVDPGATLTVAANTFTNGGTIDIAGTSDAIVAQFYTFTNDGQITLSNGAVWQVTGQQLFPVPSLADVFDNAGQITIASGATLSLGGRGEQLINSGTITLTGTASTLELDGTVSSEVLANVQANGGILSIGGTLDNTGRIIGIGTSAGFGALIFSGAAGFGEVVGGTIVNTGTTGLSGPGILDSVWQGPLIVGNTIDPYVATNINLIDPNLLQPGIADGSPNVLFTDEGAGLYFGTGKVTELDQLTGYQIVDAATGGGIAGLSTLTLDSSTTISIIGSAAAPGSMLDGSFGIGAPLFVNEGLIDDTVANGYTVSLYNDVFDNAGTILVSGAGNELAVNPGSFINSGTVLIGNGATLWLDSSPGYVASGPFDNTGVISLDATATLQMAGTYTEALLTTINTEGGPVVLTGTLENIGSTFVLGTGGEFSNVSFGASPTIYSVPVDLPPTQLLVQGGTVLDSGASVAVQDVTLAGVVWNAPLDLIVPNATLGILDGTTLAPPAGTIGVHGVDANLGFLGFDSFNVAGMSINLGAAGGTVTLDVNDMLTVAATGALNMTTPGAGQVQLLGSIVNQGLINDQSGDVQVGLPPPIY